MRAREPLVPRPPIYPGQKCLARNAHASAWVFDRFTTLRRLAIKNGVEQGHGTQSNRLGIKDLWPSASRFWKNQARVRNGQQPRSWLVPTPKSGMVQKHPFSGNTRDLSADPDRSRVGAGLRESLAAVL